MTTLFLRIRKSTALLLLLVLSAKADAQKEGVLDALSGPGGNYIYLINRNLAPEQNWLGSNDQFEIYRSEGDTTGGKAADEKKIATVRRAASISDLKLFFNETMLTAMVRDFKLQSRDELGQYFATHARPEDYQFYVLLRQTQQAIGLLFEDADVRSGRVYRYRVQRSSGGVAPVPFGRATVIAGRGNPDLNYFRPVFQPARVSDSLIVLSWKVPIAEGMKAIANTPGTHLPPVNYWSTVYMQRGNGDVLRQRLLPTVNESNDTLLIQWTQRVLPEEQVRAWARMEDPVENAGRSSDTALIYPFDPASVPLIYTVDVKDTIDAITLKWKALPNKPWYAGVSVVRYDGANKADTTILGPEATAYTDYRVSLGQTYRYNVSALFLTTLAVRQVMPASGFATLSKTTRPIPPFNLKASPEGKDIRLNWESKKVSAFAGYFVYRGHTANDLSVVAGPLSEPTFLDTSRFLNPRSTYTYAVLTQNIRQDTSIFSNKVQISPLRPMVMPEPSGLEFRLTNNILRISWNDVRRTDEAVEGYVVQRKKKGQREFETVTTAPVRATAWEDSLAHPGDSVLYRVAAVDFRGGIGRWSNAALFVGAQRPLEIIEVFTVENSANGILITWPQLLTSRKAYKVYRAESGSKGLTLAGSTPGNVFDFVDKAVVAGKTYSYRLTFIAADGRESDPGMTRTIKFKPIR